MADLAATYRAPTTLLPPVFDELRELTDLPRECIRWPVAEPHSGGGTPESLRNLSASLKAAAIHGAWSWPEQPVVFISDPHADAEGFLRSLLAAGVIRRTGADVRDFTLTAFGQTAHIVIGGDCLDKGPSNLEMLDTLKALYDTGADIRLLAGNHDLRLLLAVLALTGPRSVLTEHLFVRMGRKALPLLREVWDSHLAGADLDHVPDAETCRARLMPGPLWETEFPKAAQAHLSAATIAKELQRLREKGSRFDQDLARAGLTMRMAYAAALECHRLFLAPDGPYAWFYAHMDLICRIGSLLFVHAGLDDAMCGLLEDGDEARLNAAYREDMQRDPFAFYSGSVANLVRTKYRPTDKQLTPAGVRKLHRLGIKMVVQGHVNNHAGQRLLVKRGMLHLEGDVTLDRASRGLEGLPGIGAGATLIYPSGDVVGLSSDFPMAKHFQPERDCWEHV